MCGIAALLRSASTPGLPSWPFWSGSSGVADCGGATPLSIEELVEPLRRRGPDSYLQWKVPLRTDNSLPNLHLIQTVLSHRGKAPTSISTSEGDALLFNGELYDVPEDRDGNDTSELRSLLSTACKGGRDFSERVLTTLDALNGPWAFIFWHAARRRLYFGRDCLGRRSLMLRVIPGVALELTSVTPPRAREGFVEVPPIGLGCIEVDVHGSVSFTAVKRKERLVMPTRVAERSEGALVSGSDRSMYVSFLPGKWLRSEKACEDNEMTLRESAERFNECLKQSVQRRLVTNRSPGAGNPRFAVLFSGGIDSLVIAATLDNLLPPAEGIQLINVAFGKDLEALEQCPDRKNAISGLAELRRLSQCGREFELCCVDVSPGQADETLESSVRNLVYPCDQPMDASIGTAIWLAASARGYPYDDTGGTEDANRNCSPRTARILFSGLGADELMGGYKGRHRTIFRSEGVEGIKREMDADLSRLWFRNLGRDDRLVADHGKEVRQPFLDEDLITFVTSLPLVEHVCDLSKPDGIGDKHLLRRAARLLGFSDEAASRSKRAIQFGSRSKQVIERKRRDVS